VAALFLSFGRRRLPLLAALVCQPGWGAARFGAEAIHAKPRLSFLHNIPLHDAQERVISTPDLLTGDGKPQELKAIPCSQAQMRPKGLGNFLILILFGNQDCD
jgi:hypothetical protein